MPTLAELLSQTYAQTEPLRGATVGNLQSILSGSPASSLPAYAPNRAAIEGQYNVGLEQARSLLPRGGQLNRAILDLGQGRGRAVSDLESAIRGQALNQAAQIGFGGLPGLISGTSTSEQLAQRQKAWEQQQFNAMFGNIGQGIGLLGSILDLF